PERFKPDSSVRGSICASLSRDAPAGSIPAVISLPEGPPEQVLAESDECQGAAVESPGAFDGSFRSVANTSPQPLINHGAIDWRAVGGPYRLGCWGPAIAQECWKDDRGKGRWHLG